MSQMHLSWELIWRRGNFSDNSKWTCGRLSFMRERWGWIEGGWHCGPTLHSQYSSELQLWHHFIDWKMEAHDCSLRAVHSRNGIEGRGVASHFCSARCWECYGNTWRRFVQKCSAKHTGVSMTWLPRLIWIPSFIPTYLSGLSRRMMSNSGRIHLMSKWRGLSWELWRVRGLVCHAPWRPRKGMWGGGRCDRIWKLPLWEW